MLTKEQRALQSRLDRELLALDQKIERQDAVMAAAQDTRADLFAAREAVLAGALRLRGQDMPQ